MDGVDLLEAIAKRRSYKQRDGYWDLERTAMVFLTDYRHGTIGRISLETPTSRRAMIEAIQAKKAPGKKATDEELASTETQTDASQDSTENPEI